MLQLHRRIGIRRRHPINTREYLLLCTFFYYEIRIFAVLRSKYGSVVNFFHIQNSSKISFKKNWAQNVIAETYNSFAIEKSFRK